MYLTDRNTSNGKIGWVQGGLDVSILILSRIGPRAKLSHAVEREVRKNKGSSGNCSEVKAGNDFNF